MLIPEAACQLGEGVFDYLWPLLKMFWFNILKIYVAEILMVINLVESQV